MVCGRTRRVLCRDRQHQTKARLFHFEDDPERQSVAKLLSRDEALRIAGQLCEAAGFGGRDVLGF
jgi:hypothetical protein